MILNFNLRLCSFLIKHLLVTCLFSSNIRQLGKTKNYSKTVLLMSFKYYSQTRVQQPPLGPEKRSCYAQSSLKKISGK